QRRLLIQVPGTGGPEQLAFSVNSTKLQGGLEEDLEEYLRAHPNTKLIILDTYGRVQPSSASAGKSDYNMAVELLSPLHELALGFGLAIVVVHHTRKQSATDRHGDPFE